MSGEGKELAIGILMKGGFGDSGAALQLIDELMRLAGERIKVAKGGTGIHNEGTVIRERRDRELKRRLGIFL